jgi:RimJ/RimL family protein N-acetyltransferase
MYPRVESIELHTDRLMLRPVREVDAQALFPLINDAEVAATMLQVPHPYPRDQFVPWIRITREAMANKERYEMSIVLKETGKPIGVCSLNINWPNMSAEIGYWLGKSYWGQGYMTEAAARLLKFGFEVLGLERIHARCFVHNKASAKVLEKIGLNYEGIGRHEVKKGDEFLDIMHFGLIRSEFAARNQFSSHGK